ncbi:TadE/TadG family type IV pilus assembly protein [Paenibacillus sp.]|uniref:TadE/TadG family type IV pilus assembly protein n=1 Tax=Paenibacillus sp. TaxID=58172 RepID=UPI002D4839BF|nr:TadE/TadG family type IV pilus assembly protein [Paenibacillus sp.]HZG58206.1 TadE/TadG family type IV pilus assembly protein [Paenibacillus sp.]
MRRRRGEAGQSLLEWSILMPVILLVLFAMVDLSFILYKKHTLEQLTKEIARGASVGQSVADVSANAERIAAVLFPVSASTYEETTDAAGKKYGSLRLTSTDGQHVRIAMEPALSARTMGATIRVAAEYTYPFVTPLLQGVDALLLRSAYVALVEYVPK